METDNKKDLASLSDLLNRIYDYSKDSEEVSVEDILEMVGRRSFGPILLVAGLIVLAPLVGDIPGVPTIMAVVVFLISIQILLQQQNLWLPNTILKRSVKKDKLHSAIETLGKPASYVDRYIKPRLKIVTDGKMVYPIALICLSISLAMPVMEFIPFSANFAGAALTAFGLSLVARDGVLALFGYAFTVSIIAFIWFTAF